MFFQKLSVLYLKPVSPNSFICNTFYAEINVKFLWQYLAIDSMFGTQNDYVLSRNDINLSLKDNQILKDPIKQFLEITYNQIKDYTIFP